ncbi:hypothetical protein ABK905_08610 [Acerihabitans sp. KWT182]|uniref:Uncharacterized protein n=1 Tax=Acerihabitans sp. KWT182 TaxID=3157919 RepID=A0AAU7QDB3_9GAMM
MNAGGGGEWQRDERTVNEFPGNKKPESLEPKKAGLSGSSIWGHQRKAVALIETLCRKESSGSQKKFFRSWRKGFLIIPCLWPLAAFARADAYQG